MVTQSIAPVDAVRKATVDDALALLARGWSAFPLHHVEDGRCSCRNAECDHVGKHPRTRNGYLNATSDEAAVRASWQRYPHANVGLPTGENQLFVLDVDSRHGGDETLEALEREHGKLPETPLVLTGGGGRHFYFRNPGGISSRNDITPGIDVKANGGYVVAPGSNHVSGRNYEWELLSDPEAIPLADPPRWLLDLARTNSNGRARGRAENEPIPEGTRHDTLVSRAGTMRAKGFDDEAIAAALLVINRKQCKPPLPENEVVQIARSMMIYAPSAPIGAKKSDAPAARDGRPRIIVRRELEAVTAEALAALGPNAGIYIRARIPVRVARDRGREVRGLKRAAGAPIIEPLTRPGLRSALDRAARWARRDGDTEKAELPPTWVPDSILAMQPDELPFPTLEGVIETPTLRANGSVLQTSGYDEATALLYEPCVDFPPVPDAPTRDDAKHAIEELEEPFFEFPFVDDSDRSAASALVLTLLARAAIDGPCPLFAFRAPTPGTGKGLLANALSIIGTGRPPTLWAPARDSEEERKRILTVLISGSPAVLIDNISGALGSESLAAVLTSREYTDRLLGQSKLVTAPARAVWMATGNNVAFRGDLARRVVPIDLDPKCERPEDRRFKHEDLLAHIEAQRERLVRAGLTVLRAYHVAGRPRHNAAPMGSFEGWDRLARGALLWAGCADPCAGREKIRKESDADLEPLGALLEAWRACFGDARKTVAQAMKTDDEELRAALAGADPRGDGKNITARAIGERFRKWKGRIVSGLRLATDGQQHRVALWHVERVE